MFLVQSFLTECACLLMTENWFKELMRLIFVIWVLFKGRESSNMFKSVLDKARLNFNRQGSAWLIQSLSEVTTCTDLALWLISRNI